MKKEAESLGTDAVTVTGDAREEQTAIRAVKAATDAFGRIDILVNNTGVGNYKNLVDTSAEDYDELMDVNVRSTFLFTRHAVPVNAGPGFRYNFDDLVNGRRLRFRRRGRLLHDKVRSGRIRAGLDKELRPSGIKVGVICPGGVKTEFALGKGRTEQSVAAVGHAGS